MLCAQLYVFFYCRGVHKIQFPIHPMQSCCISIEAFDWGLFALWSFTFLRTPYSCCFCSHFGFQAVYILNIVLYARMISAEMVFELLTGHTYSLHLSPHTFVLCAERCTSLRTFDFATSPIVCSAEEMRPLM